MFEKLSRIAPVMNDAISHEVVMGSRIAVIHKGETVYLESFGMADKEKNIPMSSDTLFRLYSLTKPITAAAAMILLEKGKIELRYPLKWFFPTFEDPQVLDENGLRAAERDITLGDLLSMTSGICYPEDTPSGREMGELWGRQHDAQKNGGGIKTYDFAMEMGKKPLAFSPGEKWMYGASADIMGAVIECVSGMKFSEFLKKEIFEPLGMNDTDFYVPEEKYHRLATAYDHTPDGNKPYYDSILCLTDYRKPPAFESGGAGLVSTLEDYSKFVKMLLGNGTYNGVNILGRKTVEFMRTNNLDEKLMSGLEWDSMKGYGYGNFMRILTDKTKAGCNGSHGEFGWDGWMGCYFSIDPVEELAFMYFIQQTNTGCTDLTRKLNNIARGAL